MFRLNRYRNEEESRTVEKDELTHLWTTNKKRAIAIVKNDGREARSRSSQCTIDPIQVHKHFSAKCNRSNCNLG